MRKFAFSIVIGVLVSLLSPGGYAADPPDEVAVPIIMYHSLSNQAGDQWTLSPSEFERDLAYLKEQNYQAVFLTELIAFVETGTPLPEKPIVVTFDDCYYNNYEYALPLLEKYDMKMTLSVIGSYSEEFSQTPDTNLDYAHLSWDMLEEMQASGRVELANHTWGLHTHKNGRNGCCRKPGEDLQAYRAMFFKDVERLQEKLMETCGVRPICFTYPFGSKCPEALEAIKEMGFQTSLSCYEGQNYLRQGDADCLYDLRRNNRTPNRPVQELLKALEE